MKTLLILLFTVATSFCSAQNVGVGTSTPHNSAALDVTSSDKGFLMPRLTTSQRKAIFHPAAGLLVFDTDKSTVMFYDGSSWRAMTFTDESTSEPQSQSSASPSIYSSFGSKVAISGNYAIIGAPMYDDPGLSNMGLAFIFNKTASGWKQVARLAAPDSAAGDYFGGSVSISGDYAIVGSANKTINGQAAQGKVYIYQRNSTSWTLDESLTKPNGQSYDDFGWSVGICAYNTGGPAVAIGIPYSEASGPDRGEVYFYKRTTAGWAFVQNILPTDLANADYYGATIAMDTDYVAVGATGQDNVTYSYSDAGAVYIYAFGGGVWNYQQKLQGTTARGQFGFAIGLNSNKLAVGAPWATTYANTSSSVYLYQRTGTTWTNTTSIFIYNFEIVPNAGQIQPVSGSSISIANLTFGISLAYSGTTLLVGSSGGTHYPNGGSSYYSDRVGAVYVYENTSGNLFTRTNIIHSDFPNNGDLFGETVSLFNNKYIIGCSSATVDGIPYAGNVYFGSTR